MSERKIEWNIFDPDADFKESFRYLPHRDQTGALTFVTFRLGDSMPKQVYEMTISCSRLPKRSRCIESDPVCIVERRAEGEFDAGQFQLHVSAQGRMLFALPRGRILGALHLVLSPPPRARSTASWARTCQLLTCNSNDRLAGGL